MTELKEDSAPWGSYQYTIGDLDLVFLSPYYNSNAFLSMILFLKMNLCPLLTLNKSNLKKLL